MGKPASYDKHGMKKGAWSEDEDSKLRACIAQLGRVPNWRLMPRFAGLKRCGKSCRLRWVNYLKPGLKREKITKQEEDLIIQLHNKLGNKWSAIAAHFPGRTDNDIKNYWHAHIQKRKGGVRRDVRAQSSDINLRNEQDRSNDCTETDLKQEVVFQQDLSSENTKNKGNSDNNGGEILYLHLSPLFEKEELHGFGFWQNETVYEDSDIARFFQEDLLIEPLGEEFFGMGFL